MGLISLDDLEKRATDEPAMTVAASEAAPVKGPRMVSLDELGGVPKVSEGPAPDLTKTGSSPAPDQTALLPSSNDKLRAFFEGGSDPIDIGLRPGFHPKVTSTQVPTLIDTETGQIVAHQDLRTGEFVPRDAQPTDVGAYQAMGNAPGFLKPVVSGLHSIEPADAARFALEMYFGSKGAGAAARRFGPKLGQVAATALGETVGGGAASLGAEVFDPSENPVETAAWTAALGGATSAITGGVIKGYGAWKGHRINMEADAAVAFETLDALAKKAGKDVPPVPLGQTTTNPMVDQVQVLTEASVTGSRPIREALDQNEKLVQDEFDDVARQLVGADDVDHAAIEQLAIDVLDGQGLVAKGVGGQLYKNLDDVLPGYLGVDVTEIIRRARKLKDTIDKSPRSLNARSAALLDDVLALEGKEGVDFITMSSLPRGYENRIIIPWEQAHNYRSDLLKVGRATGDLLSEKPEAFGKLLGPMFLDAMDRAAVGLSNVPNVKRGPNGETAQELHEIARDFWRDDVAGVFEDRQIRALAGASPDTFLRLATQAKSPSRVVKLRSVLLRSGPRPQDAYKTVEEATEALRVMRANSLRKVGGPDADDLAKEVLLQRGIDAWNGIRGAFLHDLLEKSVSQGNMFSRLSAKVRGAPLEDLLNEETETTARRSAGAIQARLLTSGGTYKELFSANERLYTERLLKTLGAVQRPAGRNIPGRVMMSLSQGGALYATVMGNPMLGVLIFGTPAVAGKLLTNKKFQTMLMNAQPGMGRTAQQRAKYWTRALAYGISQGAQYEGTDPELLKLQAERDQNYGPGSPRPGSKTPQPKTATRTATP